MNNLQIFSNSQFGEIRVAKNESNEPLFCLADLCNVLGIANPRDVKARLNPKGVVTNDTPTKGGTQRMIFVDEPNFYRVVFQSRKPEAEAFTSWVTNEVLPSIRKHGAYLTPSAIEEVLTNPDTIIRIAQQLKTEQTRRKAAEVTAHIQGEILKQNAPKVQYFESILQSDTLICTNIIAKELGLSALTLNRTLNSLGVIYRNGSTWVLYNKYQNKGYTGTKTHHYTNSQGLPATQIHTYWTEKGRQFIHALAQQHGIGYKRAVNGTSNYN
jgi:prophage antirepressor-like protein